MAVLNRAVDADERDVSEDGSRFQHVPHLLHVQPPRNPSEVVQQSEAISLRVEPMQSLWEGRGQSQVRLRDLGRLVANEKGDELDAIEAALVVVVALAADVAAPEVIEVIACQIDGHTSKEQKGV